MQMPDFEEPLSAERPQFEPELGVQRTPDDWRVETNFVEAKDILGRFGTWPDDLLTPKHLESLYREECESGCGPFSLKAGPRARPSFPFLDESEGSHLAGIWGAVRDSTISVLREACRAFPAMGEKASPLVGWFNLVFQVRLILELREREKEVGLWDERTEPQKKGTIFALKPNAATTFTRASAIPVSHDSFLCVSWGGPYGEYSKVLPLLENPHTQRVIAWADDKLEVVPEGYALKPMVATGLVREFRASFMTSRWALSVPVLEWEQARDLTPVASRAAGDVSRSLAPLLPEIHKLMGSGRYSYLDGAGDYLEMAYSAFMGRVFQWAIEDGLVCSPARFKADKRGVVLERTRDERRSVTSNLSGITFVRRGEPAWEEVLLCG